jgi:diamine N-acetyltransferase
MVILKGEKIQLRAPEKSDLDLLFEWENDPSVWLITQTRAPFSSDLLQDYLDHADKDLYEFGQMRLMIDCLNPKKTIGNIDLFEFDPFNKRLGIGICIADTKERGNGYAKEALQQALDYAFEQYDLEQVFCNILSSNEVSLRLFAQAGFEQVGIKKRWIREGKVWHDEILLQKFQ